MPSKRRKQAHTRSTYETHWSERNWAARLLDLSQIDEWTRAETLRGVDHEPCEFVTLLSSAAEVRQRGIVELKDATHTFEAGWYADGISLSYTRQLCPRIRAHLMDGYEDWRARNARVPTLSIVMDLEGTTQIIAHLTITDTTGERVIRDYIAAFSSDVAGFAEMVQALEEHDRSMRLCEDPSTPVAQLAQLAHQFPIEVASNSSFIAALSRNDQDEDLLDQFTIGQLLRRDDCPQWLRERYSVESIEFAATLRATHLCLSFPVQIEGWSVQARGRYNQLEYGRVSVPLDTPARGPFLFCLTRDPGLILDLVNALLQQDVHGVSFEEYRDHSDFNWWTLLITAPSGKRVHKISAAGLAEGASSIGLPDEVVEGISEFLYGGWPPEGLEITKTIESRHELTPEASLTVCRNNVRIPIRNVAPVHLLYWYGDESIESVTREPAEMFAALSVRVDCASQELLTVMLATVQRAVAALEFLGVRSQHPVTILASRSRRKGEDLLPYKIQQGATQTRYWVNTNDLDSFVCSLPPDVLQERLRRISRSETLEIVMRFTTNLQLPLDEYVANVAMYTDGCTVRGLAVKSLFGALFQNSETAFLYAGCSKEDLERIPVWSQNHS